MIVGTFEDIDFTIVWPSTIAQSPERRPCTATFGAFGCRSMLDIGDEETLCPLLDGLYPDTWPTDAVEVVVVGVAIIIVLGVDFQLSRSTIKRNESAALSLGSINISAHFSAIIVLGGKWLSYVTKP